MPKFKNDINIGDIIHIYHMFGHSEYKDAEGIVTDYDDTAVYGTWGLDSLNYDDDWEILEVGE